MIRLFTVPQPTLLVVRIPFTDRSPPVSLRLFEWLSAGFRVAGLSSEMSAELPAVGPAVRGPLAAIQPRRPGSVAELPLVSG